MGNEPCPEDLLPKNRQNNVYGHGHVNAVPSVIESANKVYGMTLDLNVTLLTNQSIDNKVHVYAGDQIDFSLQGDPVTIHWRTWDMRDNWMVHPDFNQGDDEVSITHEMIIDRLEYLPGNTIIGNQTLLVRSILGENASIISTVHITVEDSEPLKETEKTSLFDSKAVLLISGSIFGLLIAVVVIFAGIQQGVFSNPFYDEESIEHGK